MTTMAVIVERISVGKRISLQEILACGGMAYSLRGRDFQQPFFDLQALADGVWGGRAVGLVVAGLAAGLAVVQAIAAQPYVELRLAHAAIFFAVAAIFVTLAVQAAEPDFGWHGTHG
jgi:hypothetical protein